MQTLSGTTNLQDRFCCQYQQSGLLLLLRHGLLLVRLGIAAGAAGPSPEGFGSQPTIERCDCSSNQSKGATARPDECPSAMMLMDAGKCCCCCCTQCLFERYQKHENQRKIARHSIRVNLDPLMHSCGVSLCRSLEVNTKKAVFQK